MSDSEESKEGRGFKVQDRRRFTAEGESKPDEATAAQPEAEPPPPPPQAEQPHAADSAAGHPPAEINFSAFLISLGTQALAYLGEIPNPVDGSKMTDLAAAKEMIDIIAMLSTKTKGNLEEGESSLLERLLYDLRIKYVERVRGRTPS